MIHNLILFPRSADSDAVNSCVADVLAPALKPAKGLRSLTVSEGPLMGPGGPAPYSKVVQATFESLDDVIAFGGSAAAASTAEPLSALGGLIVFYEVRDL
jgi:hypothetical protein